MDPKELFIQCHEEIVAEMMEADPSLTEDEAYDLAGDKAYERMRDRWADMIDQAKDRAKDEGKWPRK